MIKPLFLLSTLFLVSQLSACSKSILDNEDARCPFADRGGCQSMEMVNRMVQEKRYTPDGQFVQQAKGQVLYSGYK
ncbi:MAG: type IV conjugative transfer system protein TraV [Legionella sp.]|nr:type IV conjugative transfer system protein TraV [Legionella sp.]